jgi:hypothetical protein
MLFFFFSCLPQPVKPRQIGPKLRLFFVCFVQPVTTCNKRNSNRSPGKKSKSTNHIPCVYQHRLTGRGCFFHASFFAPRTQPYEDVRMRTGGKIMHHVYPPSGICMHAGPSGAVRSPVARLPGLSRCCGSGCGMVTWCTNKKPLLRNIYQHTWKTSVDLLKQEKKKSIEKV